MKCKLPLLFFMNRTKFLNIVKRHQNQSIVIQSGVILAVVKLEAQHTQFGFALFPELGEEVFEGSAKAAIELADILEESS